MACAKELCRTASCRPGRAPEVLRCDKLRHAYSQLSRCRDYAFRLGVHRRHVDLAAPDCAGCRQLVCLLSRGPGALDDGRILACLCERTALPVHPVALVCAVPDLVLACASGFASQTALTGLTPGRGGRP